MRGNNSFKAFKGGDKSTFMVLLAAPKLVNDTRAAFSGTESGQPGLKEKEERGKEKESQNIQKDGGEGAK